MSSILLTGANGFLGTEMADIHDGYILSPYMDYLSFFNKNWRWQRRLRRQSISELRFAIT